MANSPSVDKMLSFEVQVKEILNFFSFVFVEYEFKSAQFDVMRRDNIVVFNGEYWPTLNNTGRSIEFNLFFDSIPDVFISKPSFETPPKSQLAYYKLDDVALALGRDDLVMKREANSELTLRTFRRSLKFKKQILLDCCEDFLKGKNYKIFKPVSKLIDPTIS